MATAGTSPSAMLSTANQLEGQLQTQLTAIRQAATREEILPLIDPLGNSLSDADNLLQQAMGAGVTGTALDRLAARVGEARGVLEVIRSALTPATIQPIAPAEVPGLRQTISRLIGQDNALPPGQLPQGSLVFQGAYLGELQKRAGAGRSEGISVEDWTALISLTNQLGEALARHTGGPAYPMPVPGEVLTPVAAGEVSFWEKAKPYVPWAIGGILVIAILRKL